VEKIYVPPLPWGLTALDWTLRPAMRIVAGPRAFFEEPQQTHFWNNVKFQELPGALRPFLLRVAGNPSANHRWMGKVPWFHLPFLGGWKKYVVLRPATYSHSWHPGWSTHDACGCSRIRTEGAVRLLLGPTDVSFFGVSAEQGQPLNLEIVGYGTIGDGGPYSQVPLR
jgi:hypothetical protein